MVMNLSHYLPWAAVLTSGLLTLPAASQVSPPQPVFTRPALERQQQQESIRLKRDQQIYRRDLGALPPAQQRRLDDRERLQQLQQRHLQERQKMQQRSLLRRQRAQSRPLPNARQRALAQGFKREAQQQRLQQKIQRSTWPYGRAPRAGGAVAPGAFRPSPSANPRSRLRVR